jgi:hypothetical protein
MITTAAVIAFLWKVSDFVQKHKRYFVLALIALVLFLLVGRLTSCDTKPDVHIVVPNEAIRELQKQKDAELQNVFDQADERRRIVDGKVIEPKVSSKRNVTAKDLEEVTR